MNLSIPITVFIALSMLTAVCAAETISIGDVISEPYENVTVSIAISGVADYGTGTINIEYDPSVVHVLSVADTPHSEITASSINNTAGITRISAWNNDGVSGDVLFANLTLGAVGTCRSPLNIIVDLLKDIGYSTIPATVDSGSFTVEGPCPPESFIVQGFISYRNGSVCNGPVVSVTNPDRNTTWQADTDASHNYYRLELISGDDIDFGETLRFNVTDGHESSLVDYFVTREDAESGGFSLNITIGKRPGDVNEDGAITPADAAIILQMAAQGAYLELADVNGNFKITSLDALMLLQETVT